MFSSEELHHIHHFLSTTLQKEIKLNHYSATPHMVSWYHENTNFVLEKYDNSFRAYSYHTPQDCKLIDSTALPVFPDIENCLKTICKTTIQ